jgi:WD40 repeat protein
MMTLARSIGAAMAIAIALLGGAGFTAPSGGAQETKATEPKGAALTPVDFYGDPLPSGALARMGTARLRGQVLTFSADSKTLITVGADRALHYWDAADGKERDRKQLAFAVLESRPDAVHLHKGVSANGQRYVSADNKTIRVWDTATGKELRKIPNPAFPFNGKSLNRLAVTNDGEIVAASFIDFRVKKCPVYFWNTATGKEYQLPFEEKDYAYLAISPDGKTAHPAQGNLPVAQPLARLHTRWQDTRVGDP